MKKLEMNKKEKLFLLNLARESIKYFLEHKKIMTFDKKLPSKKFEEKYATFVTLTENEILRGCIGNLNPVNPIYLDVIKNAVSAAFYDPRFPKLTEEEIDKIKIEISILTKPVKIEYSSINELLDKIEAGKDGIILKYKNHEATFLPQVWEKIQDKEAFLSNLCTKTLLPYNSWKFYKMDIYKYNVLSIKETSDKIKSSSIY